LQSGSIVAELRAKGDRHAVRNASAVVFAPDPIEVDCDDRRALPLR
jgi:hypothetical protein